VLVLWAWAAFVVAGAVVQKGSEHWQVAVPAGDRAVPTAAFAALVGTAAIGSVMVLAGMALTLSRVVAMLSGGGWREVRGRACWAAGLTVVAAVWTVGRGIWAHRIGTAGRNGEDHLYGAAVLGRGLSVAAALIAWTAAAAFVARQIALGRRLLVAEAVLAATTTAAMAAMSIASLVWWRSVANAAPGFVGGGSAASPVVAAVIVMAVATSFGVVGTARAARELRLM